MLRDAATGREGNDLIMRIRYEACPLCEGTSLSEFATGDCSRHALYREPLPKTMRWVRCEKCLHVFVDGYFTEEALRILFEKTQQNQQPSWDTDHELRVLNARMVRTVADALGRDSGRWLDVGFGNGRLLTTAEEFGFSVVGLDLRESSVRTMRSMGYEAHCADLTEWRPSAPVDVISMMDVLEHMPFPRKALDAAHGMLDKGGLLYVSMPNSDSFVWRSYDELRTNPYWGEIEHYHNFGRRRLYALLCDHGFEPFHYDVSLRYFACMQVIARRTDATTT